MGATKLKCKECGADYGLEARYVCDRCFGPLEVAYEHDVQDVEHAAPAHPGRPAEHLALPRLPAARGPAAAHAHRPARRLHAAHPRRPPGRSAWACARCGSRTTPPTPRTPSRTASSRSPPRAPASSASTTLACASTGNLANSVAAHGAALGHGHLRLHPVRPRGAEGPRHRRLRDQARQGQGQLRRRQPPLHRAAAASATGPSSTSTCARTTPRAPRRSAYEIAEQLGWEVPDRVVAPIASGSLYTKIAKGFQEFLDLGLVQRATRRS